MNKLFIVTLILSSQFSFAQDYPNYETYTGTDSHGNECVLRIRSHHPVEREGDLEVETTTIKSHGRFVHDPYEIKAGNVFYNSDGTEREYLQVNLHQEYNRPRSYDVIVKKAVRKPGKWSTFKNTETIVDACTGLKLNK